jgi:signal peptidase I
LSAESVIAAPEQVEPLLAKSLVRDYAETILICVIFVIFSRAFVFQQSKIPSGSMEDTLLKGDYIMVNRFVYGQTSFEWENKLLPTRPVQRGDVVVFRYPREPQIDYIKRVAGVPGDTVKIRRGYLYVNDERIEEPWVQARYRRVPDYGPVRVDEGHYFVMGDHRDSSSDSRVWGFVSRDLIKGRALLVWYSFDESRDRNSTSVNPELDQRVKSWGYKLRHFFTRTRWKRCFSLIR